MRRWLRGTLSVFAAVAMVGTLGLGVARADDPELQVSTDASGNVSVNGVIFDASFGLDADAVVALIQSAEGPSASWSRDVPAELSGKVNQVVGAVLVKRADAARQGGQ